MVQLMVVDVSRDITWLYVNESGEIIEAYHKRSVSPEGWRSPIKFVGYVRGLCAVDNIVNLHAVQELIRRRDG